MPTLDWLNRAQAFTTAARVPYRLLEEVSVHNAAAPDAAATPPALPAQADLLETDAASATRPGATSGNLLIQGDNLEAIKALLPFYRGQVKCIFIDPPYNTRSAFEHYDDNLEHAQWLSMMLPRLQLLRELLSEDGSIWVTLDDGEAHYFKVMADEVFSRSCFIADIAWKRRDGAPNDRKIGPTYDHLFVYAKTSGAGSKTRAEECFGLMERTEKAESQYQIYVEPFGFDDRGPFRKVDPTGNAKGGRHVDSLIYPVTNPFTGDQVYPRKGRCWVYKQEEMERLVADRRYFWGKDGKAGTPMRKLFKSEAKAGMASPTIWDDVGMNQHAAREIEVLFGEKASFETPKPEGLIHRALQIATNPGDLVLDSFLGSGTTAAVAHKMGRRWIGIEMGEHAATHCLPRLQQVIDGEQGGISKAVNWQGGGGFRFMKLGAPIFDEHGRIHPDVRFATLAAFIWQQETGAAWNAAAVQPCTPYLGTHYQLDSYSRPLDMREGPISFIKKPLFACYLLFNGILGDKRPASGNVLTREVLDALLALHAATPNPDAPLLVFGEACRLGPARLEQAKVTFRHIPYDVKAR